MGYASVTSNLIDMRREPAHQSERVNQLLFGEVVKTGRSHDGFISVTQSDGYTGWVDHRFLTHTNKAQFGVPSSFMVVALTARTYDAGGKPVDPFFLYYGTKLNGKGKGDGFVRASLPSGRYLLLKASALQPIKRKTATSPGRIITEARRFLGVPYLWGGISPAGFDCSGFVRAIFGRFGINLARDTKDQVAQGEPVERRSIKSGDLMFFPGHVGIAIGRGRLIHASRGGGGVRVNSLTPGADDYRGDLDHDFHTARRIM
jgi:cell wall-associated NlpC family hydrolase